MATWSSPFTAVAGAVYPAADHNTDVRDNLNVLKTGIDDLGNLSPSIETDASTTQQDDLAITTTSGTLVFTGASDFDLTGIVAPADEGKVLIVIARGSGTVTLKDEDANSAAANRFDLGGQDVVLLTDHAILLVYENSRWRRVGQEALLTVSQAEAEAGTATTRRLWTAERVKQAIDALAGGTVSLLASASASGGVITLSSLSMSGYSKFIVVATKIQVDTDDVNIRMELNNRSTSGDYQYAGNSVENDGSRDGIGASSDVIVNLMRANVAHGVGNAAGEFMSGTVNIYPPHDNNVLVDWRGVALTTDTGPVYFSGSGALLVGTHTDVTDVEFQASSGNIDGGTVYVYGVKDS